MTNRDLLKEAIADAKAIKETAIANAKLALEEAFTPHLKNVLAAKLNEMDSYYEEDDVREVETEEVEEGFYPEETSDKTQDFYRSTGAALQEEEELDELNLDELLAELEGEEMEEAKEIEDENLSEAKEESEEESEEEEVDLENMTEEDLTAFIKDVIEDMVEAGEIEAGHEGGEEEEAGEEEMEIGGEEEMGGGEIESEEEINIDELLAELKKNKVEAKKEKVKENVEVKVDESSKNEKEMEEALATIESLRSELNEVNLLNAKLLYTNKIFKAKNLTESQKVKVLSSFDKATNVKEVKLVFETLTEELKNKKSPIKENLGRASKVIAPPVSKKPILESNDMIARFQKLAGIIK